MSRSADRGAALLLVIGATSVLATLSGLMLAAALASYEARSYRADLVQARALADAVVLQVMVALGEGNLPWPTPSRPVSVRNGVLEASRSAVPVAVFPTPPWTYWPPAVHSASLPGASVLALGATATLSRVVRPGGAPQHTWSILTSLPGFVARASNIAPGFGLLWVPPAGSIDALQWASENSPSTSGMEH